MSTACELYTVKLAHTILTTTYRKIRSPPYIVPREETQMHGFVMELECTSHRHLLGKEAFRSSTHSQIRAKLLNNYVHHEHREVVVYKSHLLANIKITWLQAGTSAI